MGEKGSRQGGKEHWGQPVRGQRTGMKGGRGQGKDKE